MEDYDKIKCRKKRTEERGAEHRLRNKRGRGGSVMDGLVNKRRKENEKKNEMGEKRRDEVRPNKRK